MITLGEENTCQLPIIIIKFRDAYPNPDGSPVPRQTFYYTEITGKWIEKNSTTIAFKTAKKIIVYIPCSDTAYPVVDYFQYVPKQLFKSYKVCGEYSDCPP